MTLVDTNVLLDLVTDDPNWADWSIAALETASLNGPLLINDVVYAELAVRYDRIEDLDAFLDQSGLETAAMPRAAPFLAGKVFLPTIGGREERAPASCRISSSAPMQSSADWRCSPATLVATAPIFPH